MRRYDFLTKDKSVDSLCNSLIKYKMHFLFGDLFPYHLSYVFLYLESSMELDNSEIQMPSSCDIYQQWKSGHLT